jgi:hypothetical protein
MNQDLVPADSRALSAPRERARLSYLVECCLVGVGYLVYSQVRGLAGDEEQKALRNAEYVVNLEQRLGLFKELSVQALVLPHSAVVNLFNIIYFYGLFPLLMATAIWLFMRRPEVYRRMRTAFLASGAIAVCLYLLVPTAPPRLIGFGFVDTLGAGLTPGSNTIPGVNHFAAMPSMHVGWNFLTAMGIYLGLGTGRWRLLIFAMPVAMILATVATANHYFVDGALGIVVASIGFGIADYLNAWSSRQGGLSRFSFRKKLQVSVTDQRQVAQPRVHPE